VYSKQVTSYRELGMGSQNPQIMMIACADSRVDPSSIFDAGPGQLFVVRNVANLVPPYEIGARGLHGVSAALEYAVNALRVPHIVVMGHGGCGGVSAALDPRALVTHGCSEFVGPWVAMLNDAKQRVLASGSFNPQHALELEGIDVSLANLMSFPFVAAAVEKGALTLHGAWFAIHHGELHWRNRATGRFEVVPMLCLPSASPVRSASSPSLISLSRSREARAKDRARAPAPLAEPQAAAPEALLQPPEGAGETGAGCGSQGLLGGTPRDQTTVSSLSLSPPDFHRFALTAPAESSGAAPLGLPRSLLPPWGGPAAKPLDLAALRKTRAASWTEPYALPPGPLPIELDLYPPTTPMGLPPPLPPPEQTSPARKPATSAVGSESPCRPPPSVASTSPVVAEAGPPLTR
jgi:carbonic anhydrase